MIQLKRILVPTDFSEPGRTALNYAAAFAGEFGATVDLLHVIEPIPPGALLSYVSIDDLNRDMQAQAQRQLEEIVNAWSECSFPVRQFVLFGYPFVEIIRHAKENDSDLIVLGTHGRGAIAHMFLGSVAEKTVRNAPCPVLTVRHPEHEFISVADQVDRT